MLVGTPAYATQTPDPVVLVLSEDLSWKKTQEHPALRAAFRDGATATLSVAQGSSPPEDPRFGYVFLGAGSRVDARVLPGRLPEDPGRVPDAFDGPAGTVRPGSLGDALGRAGVRAAAVGDRARLVTMDSEGRVPLSYGGEEPLDGLRSALRDGAGFVAVEAGDAARAARLVEAAREEEATVAVTSPNGSPGGAAGRNLAPSALVGPGVEAGLLYSPTTRTEGLLTNADVAPTLLAALDVPPPPEMAGRAAQARPVERPAERAEGLQRRLLFVVEEGFRVWAVVGLLCAGALVVGGLRGGRRGASWVVLALAGLPAGALLAAAVPTTDAAVVAALTALFAGGLAALCRLAGGFPAALSCLALATAGLILLDTAAGGALMRFSTMGYNPATGSRFYGLGNEYAAVLAGGLVLGLGTLGRSVKLPTALFAVVGAVVVLVVGLPVMGADVGGSLAVGLSLGATAGLVRGDRPPRVALWAAGGFAFAAVLFVASGLLSPDASHGSRAVTDVGRGGDGLRETLARKLLMSLEYLTNPVLLALLVVGAVVVYAGWRRARGTPLSIGILAAVIGAVASGALNDSGIVATLFALVFPFVAAVGVLLARENAGGRRRLWLR